VNLTATIVAGSQTYDAFGFGEQVFGYQKFGGAGGGSTLNTAALLPSTTVTAVGIGGSLSYDSFGFGEQVFGYQRFGGIGGGSTKISAIKIT